MAVAFMLAFLSALIVTNNGQQLKDVVTGHIKDAVRNTKVQLGYGVPVKGQSGYETSDVGKNITFILSGR